MNTKEIVIGSKDILEAKICLKGAAVTELNLFGTNVILSPENSDEEASKKCYAGAMVGAIAGRVPYSRVFIGESEYLLEANEGNHFLHGGRNGLSDKVWEVVDLTETKLVAKTMLKDLEDGLPGNREFIVAFQIYNIGLNLEIEVRTDKCTIANVTNHMYFNLSGDFSSSALDHCLMINSDKVILFDNQFIPKEEIDVLGTHLDFRKHKPLWEPSVDASDDEAQEAAKNYVNTFILKENTPAAILLSRRNAHMLKISTSYPSLVLYASGYFDGTLKLKDNIYAKPGCSIALEAQFPPGYNKYDLNNAIISSPSKSFKQYINFEFVK